MDRPGLPRQFWRGASIAAALVIAAAILIACFWVMINQVP